MTEQEKNIAVAELCGWKNEPLPFERHGKRLSTVGVAGKAWWHESIAGCQWSPPDYCNDLNACYQMEGTLTDNEWIGEEGYIAKLQEVTGSGMLINARKAIHATAPQRAEAFLRVKGKWTE